MAMSKKDYVAIAANIKENYIAANSVDSRDAIREVAFDLTKAFAADNPRFDRVKFLVACGVA